MDESTEQDSGSVTPPPPSYSPPPPAYQPVPQTPDTGSYTQPRQQSQTVYDAPRPVPKKKTWLWIVLAIVVVGLIGCCAVSALGGLALFKVAGEPTSSIDALNQAAIDGDREAFDKYFDADSVTRSAYDEFLDYIRQSADYADMVAELGEEQAEEILLNDIMPEDQFVEQMSGGFSIDGLEQGAVPFPDYSLKSNKIEDDVAELTIAVTKDGEELTYVLGFTKEEYGDEGPVWRITEIKNFGELIEAQEGEL